VLSLTSARAWTVSAPGVGLSGKSMNLNQSVGIGSDFLGYRIEELIGRGGMGIVYRAYDLRLKRPVALKLVAPDLGRNERFRERFARESELVMSLEHPNVVPIYDAGDVDGHVYLAMRLVDGTDLASLLRTEGALEPGQAMAICAQVAAALDTAHVRGLVHRDVKPSNVLLDSSGHAYHADFGLTRRLDDDGTDLGEDRFVGTPAYMAPEQLEGRPLDGRADVYSLGCVLFDCLTGEPVFVRGSRLAVAWAHLEETPPLPSRRHAGLRRRSTPLSGAPSRRSPSGVSRPAARWSQPRTMRSASPRPGRRNADGFSFLPVRSSSRSPLPRSSSRGLPDTVRERASLRLFLPARTAWLASTPRPTRSARSFLSVPILS